MSERSVLDVSGLPPTAFDARDPSWWGVTLMVMIETSTVTLMLAAYLYLWRVNSEWPPTRAFGVPTKDTAPRLLFATCDLLVLLASCVPMWLADRAARRQDATQTFWMTLAVVLLGAVGSVCAFFALPELIFRWNENAYGSIVWGVLFLHLIYLISSTLEAAFVCIWIVAYGLDQNRASDVTLTAIYWNWTVGAWAVMYAVVYWVPRLT